MNKTSKQIDTIQYTTNLTPDGEFHIIFDEHGAARASGFGSIAALAGRLPEELRGVTLEPVQNHLYEQLVAAYYAGDKTALHTIPRSQAGSDFQERVWQVINDIPYGTTISYKELASRSGNAAAIRAAGTICGLNRLILLVPCHRVLKSDGSVGSYLYGAETKEALLRREGAI